MPPRSYTALPPPAANARAADSFPTSVRAATGNERTPHALATMSDGDKRKEPRARPRAENRRRHLMKSRALIGGVLWVVAVSGAGMAAPRTAAPAAITIEHSRFSPEALTIPSGTTVTSV